MVKIGIVGGTGYTGVELIRLLLAHPEVEVAVVTSRGDAGVPVAEMFPNLRGFTDLCFSAPDVEALSKCDLVFFATPHGVALEMVPQLLAKGTRVVDLGADFRIRDAELWSRWYGLPHTAPEALAEAVYGLPEMNRTAIKSARLVANPGCYPTAVQLGFLPLLSKGLVDTQRLIADAKSGVSGAGRQGKVANLLCEVSESFKAYGASGHRHLPEIKQGLSLAAGAPVGLTFVPHLVPMIRGIEATLYAELKQDSDDLQALFESFYENEPFVDVMPFGSLPETRSVRGSNLCRISLHRQPESNVVIVLSVIDNLVKGAAGQAVQNMNIMLGLPETAGLNLIAALP
ncbi:N-acetyl-gamma-glutamyl-phosphate reductase [Hahella chejuensis]|uniref:N-acetyl-gamma-glutamyl-phosphate reductase n=1 Tax=Hahella chejuensis TaxID=158327 RepID=UPI0002EB27CF|nr:N-acetyl-gamma-glutamyl-phosphate reductase [Hahella chejuensis]